MTKTAKESYKRDEVAVILDTVLKKVEKPAPHNDITKDIVELSETINKLRAKLAEARPQDISGSSSAATDELDEVVEETAKATDSIMDCCDELQALDIPEPHKQAVVDKVTRIYEACSFQDITGQRISKVVKTLKDIEDKIAAMMETLGPGIQDHIDAARAQDTSNDKPITDQDLLNGPQLEGQGVSQDDIDKLLAEFD